MTENKGINFQDYLNERFKDKEFKELVDVETIKLLMSENERIGKELALATYALVEIDNYHQDDADYISHVENIASKAVDKLSDYPTGKEENALNLMVNQFATEMKEKLKYKMLEGYHGWDECHPEHLLKLLEQHIPKHDMVDIANYAAMIWSLEQKDK